MTPIPVCGYGRHYRDGRAAGKRQREWKGGDVMAERFAEWLRAQVERWPTIQAFAGAVGVRDSAVHAWLHRNIVPMPGTEARLAEVTETPLEEVLAMTREAREASWRARLERAHQRRARASQPRLKATDPANKSSIARKNLAHAGPVRPSQLIRTHSA